MNTDEVLEKGFLAHAQVKAKLKRVILGEEFLPPETVRSDNKCIVGAWIYGSGSCYADTREYRVLKKVHAEFHEEAYRALMLFKQGRKGDALHYVEQGPFEQKSQQIKTALLKMKKVSMAPKKTES